MVAWAFDDDPVQSETCPSALPWEIEEHLTLGGKFRAWHAHFEFAILTKHYKLALDPEQSLCTMQQALHGGLPAGLGDAGPALGLNIVKDPSARRLMLQMAKPRSVYPVKSTWHETEPLKLQALEAYCRQDVESERAIAKSVPELPKKERRVSLLDMKANERGVGVDTQLVFAMKCLVEEETQKLNLEMAQLTDGEVTSPGTQVAKLLAWIHGHGLTAIETLGKLEVAAWLSALDPLRDNPPFDPRVRRALEIRQKVAKSSLKKLQAMERVVDWDKRDPRARGQLAYYGASRTGRFAGRHIQPQNFPRPVIRDVLGCVRDILKPCSLDWIRHIYGDPLDVIASCLKACLVPSPGKQFAIYDLSQIEARVIAWLGGQKDILDVFAKGEDVYVYTQKALGLPSRQVGKIVVLALGFGMGPDKFMDTALTYGVTFNAPEAETVVKAWRAKNAKIVSFWYACDRAAKQAVASFQRTRSPVSIKVNDKLAFTVSLSLTGRPLLTMKLPSGRRLYYRNALVEGEGFDATLSYDGVEPLTKRWTRIRTYGGKLAENATQAIARDVIVEAAVKIDDEELGDLVLSAHDELVEEVDTKDAYERGAKIKSLIETRPSWALDLPVACEGGIRPRYGK